MGSRRGHQQWASASCPATNCLSTSRGRHRPSSSQRATSNGRRNRARWVKHGRRTKKWFVNNNKKRRNRRQKRVAITTGRHLLSSEGPREQEERAARGSDQTAAARTTGAAAASQAPPPARGTGQMEARAAATSAPTSTTTPNSKGEGKAKRIPGHPWRARPTQTSSSMTSSPPESTVAAPCQLDETVQVYGPITQRVPGVPLEVVQFVHVQARPGHEGQRGFARRTIINIPATTNRQVANNTDE